MRMEPYQQEKTTVNTLGKTVALVVVLALLGAMGFGTYLAFQTIVALFAALDPQVATVTGIGCLVALVATWWIERGVRSAVRQGRTTALREEKSTTYQIFVDYWQDRLGEGHSRPDAPENLKTLERLLALYGAQSVIKAHAALGGAQHGELRARFGEALVAIRKDLGANVPRQLTQDLERLLLPVPEAGGDALQPANRPVGAMP